MARPLDDERIVLKADLSRLAAKAEEALERAIQALLTRDVALAEDVRRGDVPIDRLEVAVDEECLRMLAVRQPEAGDLRLLAMVLKVTSDLERIGDQAVNLAERAIALCLEPPIDTPPALSRLAQMAPRLVTQAVTAFTNEDTGLARSVCAQDDEIDALDDEAVRELLVGMRQDYRMISRSAHLILASRHLERVADHATNIAQDAIYLVEGRPAKHLFVR